MYTFIFYSSIWVLLEFYLNVSLLLGCNILFANIIFHLVVLYFFLVIKIPMIITISDSFH